jgi:hypothetical protein
MMAEVIPRLHRRIEIEIDGREIDIGNLRGWLFPRKVREEIDLDIRTRAITDMSTIVCLMKTLAEFVLHTNGAIKREGESGTCRDSVDVHWSCSRDWWWRRS